MTRVETERGWRRSAGGDGARVSMGKENEMNVLPLKI